MLRSPVTRWTTSRQTPGATLAGITLATVLAGCGAANTTANPSTPTGPTHSVTLTNCGYQQTFNKIPQRAITTEQSSTEMLLTLGLQDRMAGTANLKTAVAEPLRAAYQQVPVLTPKLLTPELTRQADPDIVVSPLPSHFSNERVGTREELASRGVASYISEAACPKGTHTSDTVDLIAGIAQDYRNLGQIFGVNDRAEALIAEQRAVLDKVSARKATGQPAKVLWIYASFSGQPYVAGGTSLADQMTRTAGAVNAMAAIKEMWPETSWEQVAASDPDLIVIADLSERGRPGDKAEEKITDLRNNPATAKLRAVTHNAFLIVPGIEMDPSPRFHHALGLLSDKLLEMGVVK